MSLILNSFILLLDLLPKGEKRTTRTFSILHGANIKTAKNIEKKLFYRNEI